MLASFTKTQLAIMQAVARRERTLADIARVTGLTKPNLTAQLVQLEAAGLVTRIQQSQKKIYYRLIDQARFEAYMSSQLSSALTTVFESVAATTKKPRLVAGFSLGLNPQQRRDITVGFDLIEYPQREEQMTPELFLLRYREADIALITHTFSFLNTELLRACKKLRHVVYMGKFASAYIDEELFTGLGIGYWDLSQPDTNFIRNSTTEFLLASVLSLLRPTAPAEQEFMLTGRVTAAMRPEYGGEELAGKTVGIIGIENSARAVAPILQQLGATAQFADPDNQHADPFEWGVERFYSVADLFTAADIVIYSDNYYSQMPRLTDYLRSTMRTRYLLVLGEYDYDQTFMAACRARILDRTLRGIHLDYWSSRRYAETVQERQALLSEIMYFPNVRITPFLGPTSFESNRRRNDYVIRILQTVQESYHAS